MTFNTIESPNDDNEKRELKEALKQAQNELDIQRRDKNNLEVNEDDNFNERKLKRDLKNAIEEIDQLRNDVDQLKK